MATLNLALWTLRFRTVMGLCALKIRKNMQYDTNYGMFAACMSQGESMSVWFNVHLDIYVSKMTTLDYMRPLCSKASPPAESHLCKEMKAVCRTEAGQLVARSLATWSPGCPQNHKIYYSLASKMARLQMTTA